MKRRDILLLSGAAVASIGGALLLTDQGARQDYPTGGELAFPGLPQRLASVQRIELKKHDATLLLQRDGERWLLPDKGGYPVRPERVRELLVGLTELRLTEARTSEPEQLAQLGLSDPTTAGSTAVLLRLLDAGGAPIAELLLGRRRVRTQGNVPEAIYVRRPGQNQSWLAEGRLTADADQQLWIDRDVANLAKDRVRRVVVKREGEPELVLARAGEVDAPLRITTPAEPPETDDVALEEVGRAFEFLTFTEVAKEAEMPGRVLGESRFELTDNLAIRVVLAGADGNVWVKLAAEGDDEAARLNARWRGWAYQVGQWKEKAFLPRLDDLKKREEAPAAAPAETPAETPATPAPTAPGSGG